MNLLERYEGCMLGLAAGDALGTTLEFSRPGSFTPIHDIVGGGPFRLKPGQWTDDTSMAMCLAESLLACDGGWKHRKREKRCDPSSTCTQHGRECRIDELNEP